MHDGLVQTADWPYLAVKMCLQDVCSCVRCSLSNRFDQSCSWSCYLMQAEPEKDLQGVFSVFDKSGNGLITQEDLRNAIKVRGITAFHCLYFSRNFGRSPFHFN